MNSPINDLFYSLCLFIPHQIERNGAFSNISSLYYKVNDPVFPNLNIYSSPYKQIISDFSVSGASVPTGCYVNGNFVHKGQSGLFAIDYLNNRMIFSGGNTYSNLNVSGNFSLRDFNIYPSTKNADELIYETKFQIQPSFNKTLTGLSSDSLTVPGIFIVNSNFQNETYAFGGLIETTINIHSIILSDSKDQLDAVGSILIDQKYNSFPIVDTAHLPYNYYGDFKTGQGNYNYLTYVTGFSQNLGYISDASFYKLSNRDFSNRYPDLRAAFCDFQVKYVRHPGQQVT